MDLGFYDSGTADIQSFHRTVSAHVVRALRQRLEGEQVMLAYDSNAVKPRICGTSRSCTLSEAPSLRGSRDIRHKGEARAARAW